MEDSLGDRMKEYESVFSGGRLIPFLPSFARLDGKAFHTFSRNLRKPFDTRLVTLMQETTKFLVEETGALVGYTQSDEITLMWYSTGNSQIFFDGRVSKMNSILSAMASVYFNKHLTEYLPEKADTFPLFDCRVWIVPNKTEAYNVFVWREKDATRNAISSAAQSVYSHKELMLKSSKEKQEMLFAKGINFNDYPSFFKMGTYYQKHLARRKFTTTEIEKLPLKHVARTNPDLEIERNEVRKMEMPPIGRIGNPYNVLFDGADWEDIKEK